MAGEKSETEPKREDLEDRISILEEENAALRERHQTAVHYIRSKIDQLLSVMGTKPLQAQELDDETLISFDPIGIVSDSFVQILAHLHATNEELRHARDEIQAIFESAGAGICVLDKDMRLLAYNRRHKELFFPDVPDAHGMSCHEITCGEASGVPTWCTCMQVLRSGHPLHQRALVMRDRYFDVVGAPIMDADGSVESVVLTYTDITNYKMAERRNKELQVQLLQAQKMESLGRLAGGIAHDFNNILTTVIGFSEIALLELPPGSEVASRISTIREAGERAATLVNQLLAFSRKQILNLDVLNLNDIVREIGKMLERLIGENIRLDINTAVNTQNILADRGQLEQVIVNLVVNARDALEQGGTIAVRAQDVLVEADTPEHRGVAPGVYVMLRVSDDGRGMAQEVADRIFEPFFTTKEAGKGTGLGLATVYGIVRQHGGEIVVSTEEGKGTSFAVYLPATTSEKKPEEKRITDDVPRGTETVLLVEDEMLARRMMLQTLKSLGYTVFEAANAVQALDTAETMHDSIDLVLTDVIMPGMNGWELAQALQEKIPGLKVIFTSGYPIDVFSKAGVAVNEVVMLPKPFNRSQLAHKLREVLG